MINPIKSQPFKYGYRFKQKTSYTAYHLGVDFCLPAGSPIYAPVAGKAVHMGLPPKGLSQAGIAVYLIGVDGKCHRLMHMSGRACEANEQVREGQLVGYIGSTGYSTGPHLHWDVFDGAHIPTGKEINIQNFLDPEEYLKANSTTMSTKDKLLLNYEAQGKLRLEQKKLITELQECYDQQTYLRAEEKDLLEKL